MGNLLVGFHPSSFMPHEDRVHYHDNRILASKPDQYEAENLLVIKNFFHSWKTSKNEVFFLSYRAFVGAISGAIIGITLFPALRISPYISRKLFNRISSNDIFPIDNAKFLLGTIAPYFAFVGAVSGAGGSFLSEAYDRAFCTNIGTKYGVLGAVDGMLLCMLFGPIGSWTNGFIGGGIAGLCLLGYRGLIKPYSYGDFGNGTIYFNDVSEEEKAKHRKQEERLAQNFLNK